MRREKNVQQEQCHGEADEPPVEVVGSFDDPVGQECLWKRFQTFTVESGHGVRIPQGKVEPPANGSDAIEQLFVEPGFDHQSVGVFDKGEFPIGIGLLQEFSPRRSHSDREDANALGYGSVGRPKRVLLVIFPVCQKDQHPAGVAVGWERARRSLNGFGDVRATFRNDADFEGVDTLSERLIVAGQGALKKGAAGEGNQTEAIVGGQMHQVQCREFGAGHAVGRLILRKHAP